MKGLQGILTCILGFAVLATAANAQYIIMPDSTNDRLVAFDSFDGTVVNPNVFALAATGTPIQAILVDSEIWVSYQAGNRVERFDLGGNLLGQIGPTFGASGFSNIRGLTLVGNTVYVANSGTANNAPGPAVHSFDMAGNHLGFFSTAGLSPAPWDILEHQGNLLVSSSSANDDIHRYTIAGASIGTFHNSTSTNFVQQLSHKSNGNVLAATFSAPAGVYELDANTGDIVSSFAASGTRGVIELGNGNIMWTNGSGAHVYDFGTGSSTQVYTGGGRLLSYAPVPEPASLLALGAGLSLLAARRKKKSA